MTSKKPMTFNGINQQNIADNIDEHIKDCEAAKTKNFNISFTIENLMNDDLSSLKGIEKAIYIIEQTEGCPCKAHKDYQEFKGNDENKEIKLSGKNECSSSIMYVGSSTTGVKKRMKEHTAGEKYKKTYALKLENWFKGVCQVHIMICEDMSPSIIQVIEDTIHQDLNPAFGKRGSNGK